MISTAMLAYSTKSLVVMRAPFGRMDSAAPAAPTRPVRVGVHNRRTARVCLLRNRAPSPIDDTAMKSRVRPET